MNAKASKLKIGAHMSAAGGLENAITIAVNAGCQTVQLFSANQRQWKTKRLSPDEIYVFKQTYADSGLAETVVHASYLINLAAINEETYKKSLVSLKDELTRCDQLGIDYAVLHPGAHMGEGEDTGVAKIVKSLNKVLDADWNCTLLLETTAGQGSSVGYKFEHLAAIIGGVNDASHLGVCLDTCHVFAAGYDIKSEKGYQQTIKDFDRIIGLEHLKVLHINDSKSDFGSHVDRHEHLGRGKIGKCGIAHIVNDNRLNKLPLILETPKGTSPGGRDYDKLNLATLRRLVK